MALVKNVLFGKANLLIADLLAVSINSGLSRYRDHTSTLTLTWYCIHTASSTAGLRSVPRLSRGMSRGPVHAKPKLLKHWFQWGLTQSPQADVFRRAACSHFDRARTWSQIRTTSAPTEWNIYPRTWKTTPGWRGSVVVSNVWPPFSLLLWVLLTTFYAWPQ